MPTKCRLAPAPAGRLFEPGIRHRVRRDSRSRQQLCNRWSGGRRWRARCRWRWGQRHRRHDYTASADLRPGIYAFSRRLLPSQVARLLTLCPAGRLGHAHISLRQRSAAKEAVGIFLPMDKLVIPAYAGTQGQATEIPGFPPSRERRL